MGVVAVPNAFAALMELVDVAQLVDTAREAVTVHQVENTKRVELRVYEVTEIKRIKAAESTLKAYFTHVFKERQRNFEEFFTRLDDALEKQDGAMVAQMVGGIVDLAKSSPLAAMGDLGQIRAALDDPNHVFDI